MLKLNYQPFKSVGNICFNDTRKEVRNKCGDFKEFKKSKYSKNTTDDFRLYHVYYDENNIVEAVEVFAGVDVEYMNVSLFLLTYKELKNMLNDEKIECDSTGAIFHTHGISAYVPDETKIESLLFFKNGYYK